MTIECYFCGKKLSGIFSRYSTDGKIHCGECFETAHGRKDVDTKNCPYCDEEIKNAAIKCKHCGSMIEVHQEPNVEIDKHGNVEKPFPKELLGQKEKIQEKEFRVAHQKIVLIALLLALLVALISYVLLSEYENNWSSFAGSTKATTSTLNKKHTTPSSYSGSDKYTGYKGKTYRKSESSGMVNWGSLGGSDQEAADVLNDYFGQ